MKNKILQYLTLILLLFSCNNQAENDDYLEEPKTNLNYKNELIKSLKLDELVNKVLFVPDNTCKGCLKFMKENCESLTSNKFLEVYYFNELNIDMNDCTKKHQLKKFAIDYTNYDIYGITLYELNNDSVKITYIDATNIDSIYKLLLN